MTGNDLGTSASLQGVALTRPPSSKAASQGLSLRDCIPSVMIASFSPFDYSNTAVTLRHLCMCGVLGLDTFTSILNIITHALDFSVIPQSVNDGRD